jgi:hypothetical protein
MPEYLHTTYPSFRRLEAAEVGVSPRSAPAERSDKRAKHGEEHD